VTHGSSVCQAGAETAYFMTGYCRNDCCGRRVKRTGTLAKAREPEHPEFSELAPESVARGGNG